MMYWWREVLSVGFLTLQLYATIAHAQNFELQIQLTRYMNRRHLDVNNNCCNRDCELDCLSLFRFCLEPSSTSTVGSSCRDESSDPERERVLRINDDNITFQPNGEIGRANNGSVLSNPLTFRITEGNYQLYIDIRNESSNTEIAFFTAEIEATSNTLEVSTTMNSNGRRGEGVKLDYIYKVRCQQDYYGPDCSTFCSPVDNNNGHFTCDQNGTMVCLPGFVNGEDVGDGPCTVCDPNLVDCQNENSAGGQLSSGEAAAVAIPILVLSLAAIIAVVVGLLMWKYQPWHNLTNKGNDAVSNPVYEVNSVKVNSTSTDGTDGPPTQATLQIIQTSHILQSGHGGGQSQSLDSNPLYASQSAEALDISTREQNMFVDNQSLLDVLCHSGSRASSVPREFEESKGLEPACRGIQHSRSTGNVAPNQDPTGVGASVEPYKETVTFSNGVVKLPAKTAEYEPVHVPGILFDDPEYEDMNY